MADISALHSRFFALKTTIFLKISVGQKELRSGRAADFGYINLSI